MKKIITLTFAFGAMMALASTFWMGEVVAQKNGSAVYNQNCAKCHGAGGKGVENFTPDLTRTSYSASWAAVVNNGKGAMPGFKDSLKPMQVQAVLSHLKALTKSSKKK